MLPKISILTNLIITGLCLWLLIPLAVRIGLVDTPTNRKQHQGQIPLIGGISIFLGFLFSLLTLSISLQPLRSFIAGAALLVFVGVLDDFHELSARARLVAQALAGLIMTLWGHVALHHLGNLFRLGEIHLGLLSLPLTIVAVIGIINAVNMTDGIDGLAGSLALIELSALFYLAIQGNLLTQATILILLITGLLVFLMFNYRFPWRQQALVFMGDAGSMLLGFTLVWFSVDLSQGQHQQVTPAVMLWLMALPLFDITGVILRRWQQHRSIFLPDRAHLHHLLKDAGFSTSRIVFMLSMVALILAVLGILQAKLHVAASIIFLNFCGLFCLYLISMLWLERKINPQINTNH